MCSFYSRNIGVLILKGNFIFADLFFSKNIFDSNLKISLIYYIAIVWFRVSRIGNYNDKKEKIKNPFNYGYYPDNIIVHQQQ